jgi:hypothetical protein
MCSSLCPAAWPLSPNPRVDFFSIKPPLIANFGDRDFPLLGKLVNEVSTKFEVFGEFFDCKPFIGHVRPQIRNKTEQILPHHREAGQQSQS